MRYVFILLTILLISNYANSQSITKPEVSSFDLENMQPEQTIVGKGGNEQIDESDDKEKMHEKLKSILRKAKHAGVIYKDKNGRLFTNGEYKFQLFSDSKKELFSHFEYNINMGEFKVYENPISLEEEGNYRISYRGIDKVGNIEEAKSFSIKVDRTPPEAVMEIIGEEVKGADGKSYYSSGVKLDVKSFDKGSGLNMIIMNVNGKGNMPLSSSETTFTQDGDYDVAVRTIDNVYNLSKKNRIQFSIDNTKPTASIKISPNPKMIDGKKYCKTSSMIYLEGDDSGSGVSKLEFSYDKLKWKDFLNPVEILKQIDYKIYYRAVDNLGNISDIYEYNCIVDFASPNTTIKVKNYD